MWFLFVWLLAVIVAIRFRITTWAELVPMALGSLLAAVVVMTCACGGSVTPGYEYRRQTILGEFVSHEPIDCDRAGAEAIGAYDVMRAKRPDFDAALGDIEYIEVRADTAWPGADGTILIGQTHLDGAARIEIGAHYDGLVHELTHVWLNHVIGDPDRGHSWWHAIGEDVIDAQWTAGHQ
jgi:hypothetical protein